MRAIVKPTDAALPEADVRDLVHLIQVTAGVGLILVGPRQFAPTAFLPAQEQRDRVPATELPDLLETLRRGREVAKGEILLVDI